MLGNVIQGSELDGFFAQNKEHLISLVNTMMNLQISYNAGNHLTSWATISFARSTLLHGVSCVESDTVSWTGIQKIIILHSLVIAGKTFEPPDAKFLNKFSSM
jgi:hypothetical protein